MNITRSSLQMNPPGIFTCVCWASAVPHFVTLPWFVNQMIEKATIWCSADVNLSLWIRPHIFSFHFAKRRFYTQPLLNGVLINSVLHQTELNADPPPKCFPFCWSCLLFWHWHWLFVWSWTLSTSVSRAVSLVCLHAMFTPKVLWFVCRSFSQ